MLRTRILAAATATLLALGMAAGGASPALAAPGGNAGVAQTLPQSDKKLTEAEKKVWVCKYVGKPGVDERLQTGNNPIEVSVNAIEDEGWDVATGTGWFSDKHDRSYAFGYSDARGGGQDDEPSVEDCPSPEGPVCITAVWSMPSWIGPTSPSFDPYQTLVASYETECYNLAVQVPTDCGTQYQIDSYLDNEITAALLAARKLYGPNNPQESFPPNAGWGSTYKLVKNDPCPASASIGFTDPTCTAGQQLDDSKLVGNLATLTSSSVVDGQYTVVFTATGTALFPAIVDGATVSPDRTTLTFSGTLGGVDLEDCEVASASPSFIDPTCTVGQQLNPANFATNGAELESTSVVDGDYVVVFTTTGTALFPATVAGAEVSSDRMTLTFRGTLGGVDLEDCPVATASISFTDPTCLAAQSLVLSADALVNAEFGEPTVNGLAFSVTATATGTALFAPGDGVSTDRTEKIFTGTFLDRDEQLCLVTTASFTLPDATCELGQDYNSPELTLGEGVIAGEPQFDEATQTVSIVFTATGQYVFDVDVDGVAGRDKSITITQEVAGPNIELCDPPVKVTFCHATPVDDPDKWEIITTATEAINFVSGHDEQHDGDIIPAFAYQVRDKETGELVDGFFEGKNLDTVFFGWTGQQILDNNCEVPKLAEAGIDVTPVTCEIGAALDESGFVFENATYEIVDDGSTDGTYTVVFTAEDGALFADGSSEMTIEGPLGGPNSRLCGDAAGGIALTLVTCELGQSLNESGFLKSNASYEIVDSGAESGSYVVVFTADYGFRFPGGLKTLTFDGDLAERDAEQCLEPTYVVPVIDPTCEEGASLNVQGIDAANATFVVVDDGSESGSYEVVFTADEGYRFADDQTTLTVTGDLAGPNEEECLLAVAAIAVTSPDCFFDSTLDEAKFTVDGAMYEITVENAETREYVVLFTAEEGYRFDTELEGVSDDGKTLTVSGVLEAALEGEECVLPITDAFIAFLDPTCLDPEALDVPNFEYDSELVNEPTITVDEETGDFTVVFTTKDEETKFFQEIEGDFETADHSEVTREVSNNGSTLTFTGTLEGPNEELCPDVTVTVPPVTVVDTCLEQSYTLTAVEGVTYSVSVNGSLPTAVSFEEGEDTLTFTADPFDEIVVMATADEGSVLAEGYEPFEYTFAFDEECLPTAPVTTASVTWTMPDCLGNPGSYTLTNEAGVIWTVDGVVVAGNTKYTAAVGSSPEIRASLQGASEEFPTGFGWNNADQRTVWDLVFAAAAKCDLPTLALTGASNALGGLGIIAILIMMAGTGLVVARRREAASIQG